MIKKLLVQHRLSETTRLSEVNQPEMKCSGRACNDEFYASDSAWGPDPDAESAPATGGPLAIGGPRGGTRHQRGH